MARGADTADVRDLGVLVVSAWPDLDDYRGGASRRSTARCSAPKALPRSPRGCSSGRRPMLADHPSIWGLGQVKVA